MKYLVMILSLAFLSSCNADTKVEVPQSVAPQSQESQGTPFTQVVTVDPILAIVDSSKSCSQYAWKNRGKAPRGYIRGLALTYARAACEGVVLPAGKDATKDALKQYGIKSSDELRATYTLLIGQGMRESSGRYCEGRDASASNVASQSAEAGLFQTSYDSKAASSQLPALYATYKKGSRGCYLETFKDGVTCKTSDWKNWGTGEGVTFQKLEKECPAFATEYAAVAVRVVMRHYGPLKEKKAEYKSECFDMLGKVKALIEKEPAICRQLL